MIIEVKNKDIFIPVYGGNDKQPEGEQIKVHHRFLLPGERKKYIYTRPVKVDKLKGVVDSNVEAVQDEEGIARAIITSIENLEIKCGDDIVKVDTVEKMYDTLGVPKYLVSEIEVNMLLVSPVVDAEFLKKP
jgi:hypothetical protein